MGQTVEAFLNEQNQRIQTLYKRSAYTNWMAATTGEQKWSEQNEQALQAYFGFFADQKRFESVRTYADHSRADRDLLTARQLDDLYNNMISHQLDADSLAETLAMEKELKQIFNTFRPTLGGKRVTNNDILNILKTSTDTRERKEAWYASKQIGGVIEDQLLQLVRKRNADARALGFDNFYQMKMSVQELDEDEVFQIIDRLKMLSDDAFGQMKAEIDAEAAQKMGISTEELRPWHYEDPFFQEAPVVRGVDLDQYYNGKDLEQITAATFKQMDVDIADLLPRSDLYPRENKNPFGFCTDLDREGDSRVLANIDESHYWMTVMLHEFGHAAYFKYVDRNLPFILRRYAHTLTTEAIAMFFGRMNKYPHWVERFLGLDKGVVRELSPALQKMLQRQMLVSVRWMIAFVYFERELYENPEQDVNHIWWEIVQRIQYVTPPEDTGQPDWASKMHFSLAPVYYQNYLLGELTASQLMDHIQQHVSEDLFSPAVGAFLREQFLRPGAKWHWKEKIQLATGKPLHPQYFVEQFVK
jgi:oligoendopeptidase F